MDNKNLSNQFKRSIKYKNIGFLIILISIIPMAFLEGRLKYILAITLLGIGIYFESQYKCPFCGYRFDPRVKSDEITYCPKCGKKIQ